MGHLEKCCNKKFPQRQKEMLQRLISRSNIFQVMRRVNYVDEESEEEESDSNEEQLVLQIDGNGSKPFYMKGTMCGSYFKAIIDSGSPVSIFKYFCFSRNIIEIWKRLLYFQNNFSDDLNNSDILFGSECKRESCRRPFNSSAMERASGNYPFVC